MSSHRSQNHPCTPAISPIRPPLAPLAVNPIAESQAIVTSVTTQIQQLTRDRDFYRQQFLFNINQYNLISESYGHLKQVLNDMEAEHNYVVEGCINLKQKHDNMEAEHNRVVEACIHLQQKLEKMEAEHSRVTEAYSHLKQKLDDMEAEDPLLENREDLIGDVLDLERTKHRITALSDRVASLGAEYKQLLDKNEELSHDKKHLQLTIQGLEEANAEGNLQAKKIERELQLMQEDLNLALDSNMKYETRVGISELRAEIQQNREDIFNLKYDKDVLQQKWDELFEEKYWLMLEAGKMKSEKEGFLNEIANLQAEKSTLQMQNKTFAKEASALRAQANGTVMETSAVRGQATDAQAEDLEDYTKAVDKDWQGLVRSNQKVARENAVLEKEAVEAAKEKVNLRIQNSLLENRLKYLQRKVAGYEHKSD